MHAQSWKEQVPWETQTAGGEHRCANTEERTCLCVVSKVLSNIALVAKALLHIRLQLLGINFLVLPPDGGCPIIVPATATRLGHCRLQDLGLLPKDAL